MKNHTALAIALCLLLIFGACNSKSDSPLQHDDTVPVTVKIIGKDEAVLLNREVATEALNAEAAVETACRENKVSYTLEDGKFLSFSGTKNSGEGSWVLYVNDEKVDTQPADTVLEQNDTVSYKFEALNGPSDKASSSSSVSSSSSGSSSASSK